MKKPEKIATTTTATSKTTKPFAPTTKDFFLGIFSLIMAFIVVGLVAGCCIFY
jgi:hypothetical protein